MVYPRIATTSDSRPVSVRDFATGAIGNGENADAAVAAAQVLTRSSGRPLLFPTGRYKLTQSLEIDDTYAGDINTGIYGEQVNSDTVGSISTRNTLLEWGGTGTHVMRVKSRGVRIQGLGVRVLSGADATACLVWDKGTQTATRLDIFDCQFIAGASLGLGTCTDGVVFGPTAGVNNLDYGTVERCYLFGFSDTALNIKSTTGQSKGHHVINSIIGGAQYGIKTTTGSFVVYNCHIGYATEASLGIGAATDTINVYNLDSENSARVLQYTGSGALGLPWPVALYGGRWSLSDSAEEFYVDWAWSQLTIANVLFDYAGTYDPTTRGLVRVGVRRNASNYIASLVSFGNTYMSPMPWRTSAVGGTPSYLDVSTFGDRYKEFDPKAPYAWTGNSPAIPATQSLRVDTTGAAETRRDYSIQRFDGTRYAPSTVAYFSGSGSPEGAVTGNVGDEYTDVTGGVKYLKATGAGTNTGWVALLTA